MRKLPKETFFALSTMVILTFAFGLSGWSQVYLPDPERGWGDALYNTLLAFTGDGSYIAAEGAPQHNWQIRTARFLGLSTTLSAIAAAVIAFMGDRILRWRAGILHDHSVIIGASPFGLDMVPKTREVVVFDRVEALEAIQDTDRKGKLLLLPDPMTDFAAIRRNLRSPKEIIFADPDTVTNIERARLWLMKRPEDKRKLKIRIEDNTVARDLQLLSPDFAMAKLISRSETVARALVTSMAPTALAELRGQKRVHVALICMGSVNLAVAEELALRCHHHGQGPLRLTVVDRDIAAAEARIRAERPDLLNPDFGADGFSIAFLEMNALECCAAKMFDRIRSIERDHPLTAIVVAAGDDARNLAIAMRLRQLQIEKLCLKAPIFMRSDSQASVAAAPFSDLTSSVVPFGGRELVSEDLMLEALYEDLARGIHERWLATLENRRKNEKEWQDLSNSGRRPSYRAALSVVELFYAAGFQPPIGSHLAGLRLAPAAGNAAYEDAALIAKLAKTEKERWNTERRLEGFVSARGTPRDNEKKRHHLILTYDELLALNDPSEVRKDVDIVQAALRNGVSRLKATPEENCWRKVIRIGVIGPLNVNPTKTEAAIMKVFQTICDAVPGIDEHTLEILTPNAPGFDRVAALALAKAWSARTDRGCRLLFMNAAQPKTMDEIAVRHVGRNLQTEDERAAIKLEFTAQSKALEALVKESECEIRHMDMRAISVSDVDLLNDFSAYTATLAEVQDALLALADEMIFDTVGGSASWTMRALESWKARGRAGYVI